MEPSVYGFISLLFACLVSYATETVMQICHGKRRCALSADSATFGNPCRPDSRMYLKVVYTCVPRKVLKERYEGPPEDDELPMQEGSLPNESEDFYDTDPGEDHWYREPAAIPPAPKVAAIPPTVPQAAQPVSPTSIMGTWPPRSPSYSSDWAVTKSPKGSDDREPEIISSYILYLIIGVSVTFLLCLGLGISHCMVKKYYRKKESKGPDISATTEIANGFADNISEVDTDIDMTLNGPIAAVNPNMKPDRMTQFGEVSLGPKGSLYAGRVVPNTYPHTHPTNMYGPAEEYIPTINMVPPRAIEMGTLRRGVQVQMVPTMMQGQTDVVMSPRTLNRCTNAQYYYG